MIDLKSAVFHGDPGHSIAIGCEEVIVQARGRTTHDRLAPFLGHDGASISTTSGGERGKHDISRGSFIQDELQEEQKLPTGLEFVISSSFVDGITH